MKAAVCWEAGKPLVVEDVVLDAPKTGEVRVRIGAVAICHSDVHLVRGDWTGWSSTPPPVVAGHEAAGVVERGRPRGHARPPGRPRRRLAPPHLRRLRPLPHRRGLSLRGALRPHDGAPPPRAHAVRPSTRASASPASPRPWWSTSRSSCRSGRPRARPGVPPGLRRHHGRRRGPQHRPAHAGQQRRGHRRGRRRRERDPGRRARGRRAHRRRGRRRAEAAHRAALRGHARRGRPRRRRAAGSCAS